MSALHLIREVISTEEAPRPIGAFSQAIRVGDLVFPCGQVGIDPRTGKLAGDTVEAQTRRALINLQGVLEAAGSGLSRVVKVTLYLKEISDMQRVNEIYAQHFRHDPPVRSTIQVAALPLGALVEIDCVAIRLERAGRA